MGKFLDRLESEPLLADGAMGSYLFWRTGRLSERNHVYEALNLDNPDLIREIHLAYLRAGARCLTTNTFGANRASLTPLGEVDRILEINRAGVRLAREAIDRYRQLQQDDEDFFLLGSVGPVPIGTPDHWDVEQAHAGQVQILLEEGVDAILLETFPSTDDVLEVFQYVRDLSEHTLPIIVQIALARDSEAGSWSCPPNDFLQVSARLGVRLLGINCCAPWDALAFLDEMDRSDPQLYSRILLTTMPNAGGFQRIGNRFMTRVNPEFMGNFARTLAQKGVRLIGGCCEVHPGHIREMCNYLHGHQAGRRPVKVDTVIETEPIPRHQKKLNGPFTRKLIEGKFVVSVEILPPRGTDPTILNQKINFVDRLSASGLADAVDITDGSRGIPLMPAADFISITRGRLGWTVSTGDELEFIPHFTCRDLNMMGLQARLIGLFGQRIHNVLFITGDPPKMSPSYPRSTAVFDANSTAMIRFAHHFLNAGMDFGGQPLAKTDQPGTRFTIGSGFEPEALDLSRELEKLRIKIDSGADYIMTQPAFRQEPLSVLEPFRSQASILAGVLVLTGLDHARRIGQIPGVVVPESLYRQFAAYDSASDQAKLGVEIAVRQVQWVKSEGWAGLYLMSPASLDPVLAVLREGLV